jgi:hypothetical protein
MRGAIYRFTFDESVCMADAEATLQLAILGAESLFGESTVRMDAAYSIDEDRHVCVVDARNEVGRCICQIFTGYLGRELGPDAFRVRAVPEQRSPTAAASANQAFVAGQHAAATGLSTRAAEHAGEPA